MVRRPGSPVSCLHWLSGWFSGMAMTLTNEFFGTLRLTSARTCGDRPELQHVLVRTTRPHLHDGVEAVTTSGVLGDPRDRPRARV